LGHGRDLRRVDCPLPACIGCALANYVGNEGHGAAAFAIIVAVVAYVAYVLKPFNLRF